MSKIAISQDLLFSSVRPVFRALSFASGFHWWKRIYGEILEIHLRIPKKSLFAAQNIFSTFLEFAS